MKELVRIQERDGQPGVDARELHYFLEVGRDFTTWVRDRIGRYGFLEGIDYEILDSPNRGNQKNHGGDRKSLSFILSMDMAKELCMVENNAKGKQARRYFIEVEKKYREEKRQILGKVPQSFAEALYLAAKQAEVIERQRPLAESAKALIHSSATNTMSITNAAKHFGLHPRKEVFPFLREKGYLTKKDIPSMKAIEEGFLTLRETIIPAREEDEEDKVVQQAVVEARNLPEWERRLVSRIREWSVLV